ncbi:hypothetical protein ABN056_07440 [Providencia vermicola]|uniref:Uncharacterized protein n=1 Tax=Providencia stuartii TaxID=588 RepID=A0ABD5L4F5_PROST|nr:MULTISPECIES: hypothetical protein [Providencia]ELR5043371.1 hypothetical protein [Providencia rettgeri]ELR5291377.1 hypothetical protein [Providencia stuartii]MBG5919610.1 hypothetical protein [Providencia stuartii]MCR4180464.1 hypothetical protein [Providencia vermicola]URE78052.1 hypothetical protein MWH14_16810 [Providencia stuartii]
MILQIEFPDNLLLSQLEQQKKIPCHIQVSNKFEVVFEIESTRIIGEVSEYNRTLFEQRVIARAGGNYIYNEPSLITLSRASRGIYRVVDLCVFYSDFGWCSVIENGDYMEPHPFWDHDDEDPDFKPRL